MGRFSPVPKYLYKPHLTNYRGVEVILSDRDIKSEIENKNIILEPFNPECVQPSSIDVHLDNKFLIFISTHHSLIDVKKDMEGLTQEVVIDDDKPLILHPSEFILGSTIEHLTLPRNLAARIEGKSSLGRLGLLIHSTAGYIDPGWSGNLTLELSNVSKLPITLYPSMKIAQISFVKMSSDVENPYGSDKLGSRYHGDTEPMPSRFHLDYSKNDAKRSD